jgi:phosphoribosylanthranilate isomerase
VVRVKICGLRDLEAARAAVEAGADYVGFVFAATRRYVPPETAREIAADLPRRVGRVGLFVNADAPTVREIAATCGLDYVQLCGDEPPEFIRELGIPAIKSLRVRGPEIVEEVGRYAGQVAWCILDTFQAGAYGGTGATFDWRLAQTLAHHQIMLAGGLDSSNVARAIQTARPWGVDVSSGVETDGRKDPEKIYSFVRAAKATGSPLHSGES